MFITKMLQNSYQLLIKFMFDYKLVLLDPIMQANVVLKNNYKMSISYITMIAIENVLLIQSFCNIIGKKFYIIWMHYFKLTNLKQFPFPSTSYILSLICTTLQYLVALQTLILSLLPIIRKKNIVFFSQSIHNTLRLAKCQKS